MHAQDEKKKVDFVYDVNFEMNFDNMGSTQPLLYHSLSSS